MSLVNKKVKIKIEKFDADRDKYSNKFLKFIDENKNRIFTVKQEKKHKGTSIYTFKEDDTWLFYENTLEKIK